MRRTLTVLVASAALLVPASAASAAQPIDGVKVKTNASCSNGKGGNGNYDPLSYNGAGNVLKAAGCVATVEVDPCVVNPDLLFCKDPNAGGK